MRGCGDVALSMALYFSVGFLSGVNTGFPPRRFWILWPCAPVGGPRARRQPEMAGQHSGFPQPLPTTQGEDRLTGLVGSRVNRGDRPMSEDTALHRAPEMVHRVSRGGRCRQQPQRPMEHLGQPPPCRRRMRCPTILKEDDLPAPPLGANHAEEGLMGRVVPGRRDAQQDIATLDMQRAVQDASGVCARYRDRHLCPPAPIGLGEGRHRSHNGLIEHEEDRPWAGAQPPLEPPCAWRQVAARWASR
jgi:hypothetical protein